MSTEFVFRILGMIVFAILGARFGAANSTGLNLPSDASALIFSMVGALTGLVMSPWITTRPASNFRRTLLDTPIQVILMAMVGLLVGLIIALLIAWPLSLMPDLFGQYMPLIGVLVSGYFCIFLFASRSYDILNFWQIGMGKQPDLISSLSPSQSAVLMDTSVIIDGRILEMSKTGFVQGTLLIPQFVLSELQNIANSSDPLRRQRGRHGLEILNKLKREEGNPVQVIDDNPENIEAVDAKLVAIAQERNIPLMTNDFNLNGVAEVQGVPVLNVNELSLALQPVLLPGETMVVHIVAEGREHGQGVGYLKDGTMVVVENGRRYLDRRISVVITRYIRSQAGKMYFGVHEKDARNMPIVAIDDDEDEEVS